MKDFDHKAIRKARKILGLSQIELAMLLETDAQSVSRWEMSPDMITARKPPVRAVRLIQAYLDGFRPDDWPGLKK